MGGFWKVWKIPYFFFEPFPNSSVRCVKPNPQRKTHQRGKLGFTNISPKFLALIMFLIRSTMRTMRPARIKCKNILSWISAQHSRVQTMNMSMTTTKTGLQTTTANFRREIMSWNFWTKRNLWQFSINNSMSVRVLTTQGNFPLQFT